MLRVPLATAALLWPVCLAYAADRPTTAYDAIIAKQAKAHGVPETFVHRIVMRESRYNPRLVHRHCYGLMQIKHATARSMGYNGNPRGLLDAETNLTYAIPYLANAYHLAGGDEKLATVLFSSGYYYTAKRKGMLGELRTAMSPPEDTGTTGTEQAVASEPPSSPLTGLLSFLNISPAGTPPGPAAPESSQVSAQTEASVSEASVMVR
ncbi:MAG TPA: lytic transglycosylase domain-containing protein [Methylocella sp.]|nr:lytic transglycosylase domain-containing protein [Methylocella sp.]